MGKPSAPRILHGESQPLSLAPARGQDFIGPRFLSPSGKEARRINSSTRSGFQYEKSRARLMRETAFPSAAFLFERLRPCVPPRSRSSPKLRAGGRTRGHGGPLPTLFLLWNDFPFFLGRIGYSPTVGRRSSKRFVRQRPFRYLPYCPLQPTRPKPGHLILAGILAPNVTFHGCLRSHVLEPRFCPAHGFWGGPT